MFVTAMKISRKKNSKEKPSMVHYIESLKKPLPFQILWHNSKIPFDLKKFESIFFVYFILHI